MGLIEDLGAGGAGLDTSVFIYFMERHPRFYALTKTLFDAVEARSVAARTSALTLLEVSVMPLRQGRRDLVAKYEAVLGSSRGLDTIDIGLPVLRAAAHLRATTKVRTPDAIHIATALLAGCSSFVTGDLRLPDVPGLRIIRLPTYLPTTK